jgi:hypothetical protein
VEYSRSSDVSASEPTSVDAGHEDPRCLRGLRLRDNPDLTRRQRLCGFRAQRRGIMLAIAAAFAVSCASSPAGPSDPSNSVIQGQTVNAIDRSSIGKLSVQVGSERAVTTDETGRFQIEINAGTYPAVIRGAGIVERQTSISSPSETALQVSLIPASFDLTAFDEMVRTSNARLQRWTSQPSLIVLASVMLYRDGSGNDYNATSDQLLDTEVEQMVADLTDGLTLLTGQTYTSFASIAVERPSPGQRVTVARPGHIVVGEYKGIASIAGTIGYGTWAETTEGSVVAGAMFLDRDFDQNDGRRRLLRIHELGHALGFLHVTARPSIMNPSLGFEPTEFDRASAAIAFQRQPGNRPPDIDPAPHATLGSRTAVPSRIHWVPPVE